MIDFELSPAIANSQQMIRMMDQLEDHDDVQSVSANFNIPTELMEKAS